VNSVLKEWFSYRIELLLDLELKTRIAGGKSANGAIAGETTWIPNFNADVSLPLRPWLGSPCAGGAMQRGME
jgi:hypothetical protein